MRRAIAIGVSVLALCAAPAYASLLHCQTASGATTASRRSSGCVFQTKKSVLNVTCGSGGTAHLTYVFTTPRAVVGAAMSTISAQTDSHAVVHRGLTLSVNAKSLKVNVTVSGRGTAKVSSVGVTYLTAG